MTNILQLPGWVPTSIVETDERMTIHAVFTKKPDVCQVCGVIDAPLYKHGQREVTFLDTPIRKPTRIIAKVQRYRCRECSGLFPQPLDGIDAERRMTLRCVAYIGKQCLIDTFQRVSEHLGCDEKTIRNVATDHIEVKDEGYKPYLPECSCPALPAPPSLVTLIPSVSYMSSVKDDLSRWRGRLTDTPLTVAPSSKAGPNE